MKKTLLAIAVFLAPLAAHAAKLDSTFTDWNVYTSGKNSCYMASAPISEDGNFKKRGQPYFLVNFKEGKPDEVNISSGFKFKKDVDAELTIEGKKFKLFTEGETAWAHSSAGDKEILAAMKVGAKMKLKGISSKGSYSEDTYSLKGVNAAYKKMTQLCKGK